MKKKYKKVLYVVMIIIQVMVIIIGLVALGVFDIIGVARNGMDYFF